jgi:hypothetical protein
MGYQNLNERFQCPVNVYDGGSEAAQFAAKRDAEWFSTNRKATWRVRPLFEGESPFVDGMRSRNPHGRALAVVINHERAQDKRADGRIGVYPIGFMSDDPKAAKGAARDLAQRMVKHFKRRSSFPDLQPGEGLISWG